MKVVVVVPYWPASNVWRSRAFDIVHEHLGGWGSELVVAGERPAGGEGFNKARTLNAVASELSADTVMVMNDADSLVGYGQLEQAVRMAVRGDGPVIAFTSYWCLSRESTSCVTAPGQTLRAGEWADFEWVSTQAPSTGVCAVTVEAFRRLGGLDEGFEGWGFEDLDFVDRAVRAYGRVERVSGPLYHLWHEERRPDRSPVTESAARVLANRVRFERLQQARETG